jgi:hypothetical protein
MTWTWRRTAAGLADAVDLALAAVGVFAVGDHQRSQLVEHGSRAQAVVTADHDDEIDHWYTVSYPAQGQAHSANLRQSWLIGRLRTGQVLTVYVDPDDPERVATADGYGTPVWTPAPGWLAVLAMLAAFISVAGRLFGTRRRTAGVAAG